MLKHAMQAAAIVGAVLMALTLAGCSAAATGNDNVEQSSPATGPNSCQYANDGQCDSPDLCPVGTDTADCTEDNGEDDSPPDGDGDGIADSVTRGCGANPEIWRGLRVCGEHLRDGYDRDAFGTGYRALEDDIIAALPPTMKAMGKVYTPYSCIAFDITPGGTAATDIEHIVSLAEAHDSGISADVRRNFASDLDNLTIADPTVNRSQKGARDAAEWKPDRHGAWFALRVIQVKREYGLTVDPAERDALEALLVQGEAQLNCVSLTNPESEPEGPPPPPVRKYSNCTSMRDAGWKRGVNRDGGTYQTDWDDAEQRTYRMNTARDRDKDGHACE